MKVMRSLVVLLPIFLLSGCATPIDVVGADLRTGDQPAAENFVAFLSIVRTTQTTDADFLKLRRRNEDGTAQTFMGYDGRDLQVGMDSLELYALELPPGTYHLDEMYDRGSYGDGYRILYSFPFADELGTFSGQSGDVVMLGTVFVYERLRRILSARPADQNLEAQAKLFRDAFPGIDFVNSVAGWDGPANSAYAAEDDNPVNLMRGGALGFHSPLVLSNGDLAVGTNAGTVRVFLGQAEEVVLDTGMTSGPVLAIAEPSPAALVATSGAEMRQYDPDSRSWVDVQHNLPDGFIEDLIEYEDGYIAVVRSMVTSYVAKGDFGKTWTVIASTPSYENRTHRSSTNLNPLTAAQEPFAHNAERVGDRLFVHVGGKVIWEVDLTTGASLTTEMPRSVRSFNVDAEGLFGCRCDGPQLGFDHLWASIYLRDEASEEWAKLKTKVSSTDILSDIVISNDGDRFYVIDRLTHPEEQSGRTEIYRGGYDLDADEPVFSFSGHNRFASRFQNGKGIYVTNYVDSLAYSLDGGRTWRSLRTQYFP